MGAKNVNSETCTVVNSQVLLGMVWGAGRNGECSSVEGGKAAG